jgi:peptidoglycan/LPS O-acetylase OafA/YrhL
MSSQHPSSFMRALLALVLVGIALAVAATASGGEQGEDEMRVGQGVPWVLPVLAIVIAFLLARRGRPRRPTTVPRNQANARPNAG